MKDVEYGRDEIFRQISELADEYRTQCLRHMRREFYPETDRQELTMFDCIQMYGDVYAFRRAGKLKAWLLQNADSACSGWFCNADAMAAAED